MTRSVLIAIALLGAQGLVQVSAEVTSSSPLASEAQAADFRGRIKRIRIKERQPISDYKVRVVTNVEAPAGKATDATVELSLIATDGGPAMAAGLFTPRNARVRFGLGAEEYSLGADSSFSLKLQVPEEVVMDTKTDFPDLVAGGGWVEGLDEASGLKARVRLSKEGDLTVVVMNDDRDWDPAELGGVTLSTTDADQATTSTELTYERTRLAWVASLDSGEEAATGYTYSLSASLSDADGAILDSVSDTVVLDDAVVDSGISTVRLSETRKGLPKLVTWTWSEAAEGGSMVASLVDSLSGEELLSAVDDSPMETLRHLSATLSFEKNPAGATYPLSIVLVGEDGSVVDEASSVKLTAAEVDEYSEEITGTFFASEEGVVALVPSDEDQWTLHLQYWGESVAQVSEVKVAFESGYTGPAPKSSSFYLDLDEEWRKWVQKGSAALSEGAAAQVSLTLEDDEGSTLDAMEISGDAGRLYEDGFGPEDIDVFIEALASGGGTSTTTRFRTLRLRR